MNQKGILKKAQSTLEYLAVAGVFAAAAVGTVLVTLGGSSENVGFGGLASDIGEMTLDAKSNLTTQTLADGLDAHLWPKDWQDNPTDVPQTPDWKPQDELNFTQGEEE